MSRTTYQRSVNATVKPSQTARIINTILLLLMMCFLFSTSLPFIVILGLILFSSYLYFQCGFLPTAIVGHVIVSETGELKLNQERFSTKYSVFSMDFLGVIIGFENNHRRILWRDSVTDEEYRTLIVQLKAIK
ncbi:hypothetical protein KP803_15855 [Vibrio sp. ZSDE26]|uniref:Uncharacterized protein n=1 Tax=Vibrio amylolyticus TaxID=2847292 RepID=A0A9X1XKR6_9VIBR|nr:protein YgfX [Vibrio amylolyticus]MCK6264752.1 hypothetical protein [Vibrio amylolyticus]